MSQTPFSEEALRKQGQRRGDPGNEAETDLSSQPQSDGLGPEPVRTDEDGMPVDNPSG